MLCLGLKFMILLALFCKPEIFFKTLSSWPQIWQAKIKWLLKREKYMILKRGLDKWCLIFDKGLIALLSCGTKVSNYSVQSRCSFRIIHRYFTFLGVSLNPPTNRLPTTHHLPTDQPTTDLRPSTNRPLTKCTDHRPTDHRSIRNLRTRNSITNLKWITVKASGCVMNAFNEIISKYFLIKAKMS